MTRPRERKRSLEDHGTIRALLNRYAWMIDHDRSHELRQLRTSDAVTIPHAARKARRTRHHITNVRIEADGPDATSSSSGPDTCVDTVDEFHDELVATAAG
jgi:hypothetical protein